MRQVSCRLCGNVTFYPLIDLGLQPLAKSLILFCAKKDIESFFPLDVNVCKIYFLFQTGYIASP